MTQSLQFHFRVVAALLFTLPGVSAQQSDLGVFSDHTDVGNARNAGSASFNSTQGVYRVSGSGENMWFNTDAFQFVWKKASGNLKFAANIRWIGSGGNPHRKACLIIRQSLAPDSPYADAVLHGNGLVCLQYREYTNGATREIQSATAAPQRMRIEKIGDYLTLWISAIGEPLRPAGGSFRLRFSDPFYIGLAVCAHDNNVLEEAEFSNVDITTVPANSATVPAIESTLEFVPIASMDRRVVHHTTEHIEAPNWSRDGLYLLYNSKGRIYRIPVSGGEPQLLDTGHAIHCNNDHGISPDGKLLAISDQSAPDGLSRIYILPVTGGTPRVVTPSAPSYWHGWSPDGTTLAYCAQRNGEFDIYTIPTRGGAENRLTTTAGLDDGPDYSPDGRFIYFNSDRTGSMQIWKMKADGSEQQQITKDNYNNWFPHPSPDGRWLVFLSYPKDVTGHPAQKDVALRLIPTTGGRIQTLAKLFGGQGTLNVPSWAPDSQRLAFVSYQRVYP